MMNWRKNIRNGEDEPDRDVMYQLIPGVGEHVNEWDWSNPIEQIKKMVLKRFIDENKRSSQFMPTPLTRVRLLAILFARPGAKLTMEHVIPNFGYLHLRSGDHMDIYCAGYDEQRNFQEPIFVRIVEGLEKYTSWKYTGETDVIILNTRYDGQVDLDFREVVSFSLEAGLRNGAIHSVPAFFERLIRFSAEHNGADPAWGFSDVQGKDLIGSALLRIILSLLPKGINEDFGKAKLFALKDVARTD